MTRTGGTGDVSVTVTLTDGTATSPDDYDDVPVPVVLEWLGGDTTDKAFTVTIVDDTNDEPEETLTMTLGSPTGGAVIGNPGSAPLDIIDDDVAGTVQFTGGGGYIYAEDGTTVMPVDVTRTGGIDGEITVTVTSTDGTANSNPASMVEPQDYSPLSVVVTFPDQSTIPSVTPVPLNIVADTLPELDETFTVSLTNPTNGAIIGVPASATVTIDDDDDMLEIQGLQLNEFFGSVVAKLGPKLIVGAPGLGNGTGGFATVEFNGPSVDILYFPAPPFGSGVGRALSVDGLNVLVGGLSNVYHYHDPVLGNASPTHSILNALDGFGFAVHLTSSRIIVGAPNANGGAGAVLVYDSAGSFLQQIDGRAGELFGTSLAPAGSNFAVGAPGNEGSVQFFGVGQRDPQPDPRQSVPGRRPRRARVRRGGRGGRGQPPHLRRRAERGHARHERRTRLPVRRLDDQQLAAARSPDCQRAVRRQRARDLDRRRVGPAARSGASDRAGPRVRSRRELPADLRFAASRAPLGDFGASMCEFDGAVAIGAPKVPALIQQGRVFMFRLPVVP